jgi:hypothetical protein
MSYTPLDVMFKRKKLEEEKERIIRFPDKRRFRSKMGVEESIEKSIISEMINYGISSEDISRKLKEFKKIPFYHTLNTSLFLETYIYFSDRKFDFGLVIENFDYDFEKIISSIYTKGLFGGRKFTPVEKYKFRQDLIMYMYLVDMYIS